MNKKAGLILFMLAILLSSGFSAPPETTTVCPDCNQENLKIQQQAQQIEALNDNIRTLTDDVAYYKNLSGYYKELYEGSNSNTTNRELIAVYQQMNVTNNNVQAVFARLENIENNTKNYTVQFGASLVGSFFGVSIAEFIINFWRKRGKGKHHGKDNERTQAVP